MDRFNMFKNLMVMALADGKLREEEIGFLSSRASRWGMSGDQFHAALQAAEQPDAHLQIPGNHQDRLEMLSELIRMMAADGHLAEIEKQLFAVAAATMQISEQELNQLLDTLLK